MKVVGIIQARMGSSRLPGKILYPLAGHPLLEVLVRRMSGAPLDELWLATTDQNSDDITAYWGQALGLKVFRGDTEDVLSRFSAISRESGADWILRLTADNPFMGSEVADYLLAAACNADPQTDAVRLKEPRTVPLGFGESLVRSSALLSAEQEIPPDQKHHRTHVTSWTLEQSQSIFVDHPLDWPERPDWRWTVDTVEDFEMASAVFRLFGSQWSRLSYKEMVDILDKRPDLIGINQEISQKEISQG